jgi:hypothetical protein
MQSVLMESLRAMMGGAARAAAGRNEEVERIRRALLRGHTVADIQPNKE